MLEQKTLSESMSRDLRNVRLREEEIGCTGTDIALAQRVLEHKRHRVTRLAYIVSNYLTRTILSNYFIKKSSTIYNLAY